MVVGTDEVLGAGVGDGVVGTTVGFDVMDGADVVGAVVGLGVVGTGVGSDEVGVYVMVGDGVGEYTEVIMTSSSAMSDS